MAYKLVDNTTIGWLYYYNDIYNVFSESPKNKYNNEIELEIRKSIQDILDNYINAGFINILLFQVCKKEIVIELQIEQNIAEQVIQDIDNDIQNNILVIRFYEVLTPIDKEKVENINHMIEKEVLQRTGSISQLPIIQ